MTNRSTHELLIVPKDTIIDTYKKLGDILTNSVDGTVLDHLPKKLYILWAHWENNSREVFKVFQHQEKAEAFRDLCKNHRRLNPEPEIPQAVDGMSHEEYQQLGVGYYKAIDDWEKSFPCPMRYTYCEEFHIKEYDYE